MMPLWTGAIPAGVAYGVAARGVGLGPGETQVMSLIVFSSAGQVGALSVLREGGAAALVIATAVALNAQLPLLGVTIGRQLRLSWPRRLAVAALLTDGAYGIAAGRGPLRLPVLLGAGAAMYLAWNVGTALGVVVGERLPNPDRLGFDLVIPLTFLAVFAPLVRGRSELLVVIVAGTSALLLSRIAPAGVGILGGGIAGAAAGAWATRDVRSKVGATPR